MVLLCIKKMEIKHAYIPVLKRNGKNKLINSKSKSKANKITKISYQKMLNFSLNMNQFLTIIVSLYKIINFKIYIQSNNIE